MTDRNRSAANVCSAITVREARADELAAVMNVLDGAALETDAERVRAIIDCDAADDTDDTDDGDENDATVLVAVPESTAGTATIDPPIVGALVLVGDQITTVAVRRRRRDQGVGTALVSGAAERRNRLVARFDDTVNGFYESLGFRTEAVGDGDRRRGVLDQTGQHP